jgi:uncharacterized protein DUF6788
MVDPRREPGLVPAPRPPDARRIAAELAKVGPALPGTVIQRFTRCGRPGCRCMADPPRPHGPYWSWTRKIGNKTVTRYLSDEQWADYQPWFDNARRARALLAQLEAATLAAVEADPRSTHKPRPAPPTPPTSGPVDKPRSRRR